MTTIGALLLLAGIMVALPFILVGAGDEPEDEGRVSRGWMKDQRRKP